MSHTREMTSFLRRLFGESQPSASKSHADSHAKSHSNSSGAVGGGRQSVSRYSPTPRDVAIVDAKLTSAQPAMVQVAMSSLQDQFRAQFLAAVRQVENELVSDDPLTADLRL